MRITVVNGPFLPVPPLLGGAVERIWQGLSEVFAAKGHHVTLLCRSFPGQAASEVLNDVRYARAGGFRRTGKIGIDLLKDLAYSLAMLRMLPRADILVTNVFWLPVLASRFRRHVGKVVVNAQRLPRGQYWLYISCARFAVVSRAIRDGIAAQRPTLAQRIRVIPNPVDTSVFKPPNHERLKTTGEPTILFVGRVHPEKGVHLLVEAFAQFQRRFPRSRLKIVGPVDAGAGGGGNGYYRALHQGAKGFSLEFTGLICDKRQLAEVYRSADIFCYPTVSEHTEGFGVAPLEAMACGVVPIVSDLACFRDFIVPGQNGFVFDHRGPDAAKRLSAVLTEALSRPEQLREMSRHAALKAAEFSYERIAEQYLKDFEELCQERSYP